MIETLTLADVAPEVGAACKLFLDDGRVVALTLAEAASLGKAVTGAPRDPFSIQFQGPPDVRLPQGTYRIELGTRGTGDIFIVPIAKNAAGFRYEAIFT